MRIDEVTIENCRIIQKAHLAFSPDINFIYGENGSGKTSIVEALSILSKGRSFRSNRVSGVISYKSEKLLVTTKIFSNGGSSHVGVEKSAAETRIRIDKKDIRSQAELSQYIPLTIIYPDAIRLITGAPSERRAYLDWIGFYLFPAFHQQWKHYQRILKQRNAYLRTGKIGHDLDYWTSELITVQGVIHKQRKDIVDLLKIEIVTFQKLLMPEYSITLALSDGFPTGISTVDANDLSFYKEKQDQELKLKRTLYGAHNANLLIKLNDNLAHVSASRGQLKLLSIALLLAQSSVLKKRDNLSGVIIVDDVTSELDEANQAVLLNALSALDQQIIITAPVCTSILQKHNPRMFHVKHGVVSRETS